MASAGNFLSLWQMQGDIEISIPDLPLSLHPRTQRNKQVEEKYRLITIMTILYSIVRPCFSSPALRLPADLPVAAIPQTWPPPPPPASTPPLSPRRNR